MDELITFPNLQRVLEEFAQELKAQYQYNLNANDRFASRNLMNSVECIVKHGKSSYTVSLKLADYWYYVENGRKAGKMPPIDNILEWVRIKPILPYPDDDGHLPTPRQLAFLIARKIGEEGTKGTHDLRKATDDIWADFQERIYMAIDKDFDEVLIKIFHY